MTLGLFVVTALAEIVGCYLPYLWLRRQGSPWLLLPAVASLALFSWLLTLHPKVGLWLQLGGHCEPEDGTLAEAALREAVEESGIESGLTLYPDGAPAPVKLDRHAVRCAGKDQPENTHLDVQYLVLAPPDAVERISEESLELRWFGYDELPELTDRSLRELVARARKLLG